MYLRIADGSEILELVSTCMQSKLGNLINFKNIDLCQDDSHAFPIVLVTTDTDLKSFVSLDATFDTYKESKYF